MKNPLTLMSVLALVLTFCGRNQAIEESLDRVEACISESPDSALMMLESMDSVHFDSKRQNARYALLKSIAFDKNYIDRTDDSLVNIAVNYYHHRHNALYKFKSYYYQARVYQNAGQMDKAMESLVRAEHIKSKRIPLEDLARLHFTKAQICFYRFDLMGELSELQDAALYSRVSGNNNNYMSAILSQANTYLIREEFAKLDSCLFIVNQYPDLSYRNHLKMLDIKLLYSLSAGSSIESLKEDCENYIAYAIKESDLDWKTIARVYNRIGENESAEKALERYIMLVDDNHDESYYYLLALVQRAQGECMAAYDNIIRYAQLSDSLDLIKINQEIKAIQKDYESNVTIINQKFYLRIAVFVLLLIISLGLTFYHRYKKGRQNMQLKYEGLKREYEELLYLKKRILPIESLMGDLNDSGDSEHNALVGKIIEARIKALSSFLNKDMPDSLSKVADTLDELLDNRYKVTDSIGLIYAIYYPHFVSKLTERGLTASEIGYCCLLVVGLKTSELPKVVNYSNTYNISSRLRAKLGLKTEDGTLSAWLKRIFNENR